MEGIDAFSFQEPMNTKSRILETITSWLDLDESFNNTSFPQELQDLQMLDDHFFQFATTTNTTTTHLESDNHEPLPNLPGPDSPFILDLHDFDQPPPPPQSSIDGGSVPPELSIVPEHDECDTFLINETDFGLINAVLTIDQASPDSMSVDTNHFLDSIISNSSPEMDHEHDQQRPPIIIHEKSSPEPQQDTGDDEDEDNDEDPKKGTLNCKNLVSERNRRKRLSQQLLALRALVPNITKMDKRSVLVDALSYLKSMQEETARLQRELKEQPPRLSVDVDDEEEDGTQRTPRTLASCTVSKPKPQIIEIDTEKIEDKRFVVKITCKGANVGGDVLRVIESLGFEITYAALDQLKPQHILTTIFIRVKKQEKMTEEKLKDCIISTALRSGLTLVQPS